MGDAFKALADPTRRRILELLAQGDLTAGEIAAHFDMTKPSVSHHLNILRSAALITDERRGQNIVYSVNLTVFQELMKWFYDCGLVKGDDSNEKESTVLDFNRGLRAEFCRAPVLLPLPAGHCAHPLGSQRAGQRLGAEIHGFDFGRAAVCDVDFV